MSNYGLEIKIVKIRKDGVKYCIIPKKSELKEGDRVLITNDLRILTLLEGGNSL